MHPEGYSGSSLHSVFKFEPTQLLLRYTMNVFDSINSQTTSNSHLLPLLMTHQCQTILPRHPLFQQPKYLLRTLGHIMRAIGLLLDHMVFGKSPICWSNKRIIDAYLLAYISMVEYLHRDILPRPSVAYQTTEGEYHTTQSLLTC